MALLSGNEDGGAGREKGEDFQEEKRGMAGVPGVHQHKGDTVGNREPKKDMGGGEGSWNDEGRNEGGMGL